MEYFVWFTTETVRVTPAALVDGYATLETLLTKLVINGLALICK